MLGLKPATAHPESKGALNTVIDLFSVEPTDLTLVACREVGNEYFPTTNDGNSFPVEFDIKGNQQFVNMAESSIRMEVKFVNNAAGGNIVAANNILPVPGLMHAMWKQVSVYLNGTLITEQSDMYSLRSYFETLLNHGEGAAKTVLSQEGWYLAHDFPPTLTVNNTDAATPHADYQALPASQRQALIDSRKLKAKLIDGQTLVMSGKPHTELFHLDRLLVPGVDIRIKFDFNEINYYMKSIGMQPRLASCKMVLVLAVPQLNADLNVRMHKALATRPAIYPNTRTELKVFSILGGEREWQKDNVFEDRIPQRMLVVFQHTEQYQAGRVRTPFSFAKFELQEYSMTINGEQYPATSYQLDPATTRLDGQAYLRLLKALGEYQAKSENFPITPEDWSSNLAIFAWNNAPSSQVDEGHLNPKMNGNMRLRFKFANPTAHVKRAIVLGEFQATLTVGTDKSIFYF